LHLSGDKFPTGGIPVLSLYDEGNPKCTNG
jgi:hypothetical protein